MSEIKEQVQSFVHKYLDVTPEAEAVIVDYALQTWQPLPLSVKYLQFVGDLATGKTRAAQVMWAICKNPLYPVGHISPSALVPLMDKKYPCTLILDEFENLHHMVMDKVFEFGDATSKKLTRMIKQENGTVKAKVFETFGYKVLCCYRKFQNPAIQSRCITVKLSGITRKEVLVLSSDDFKKDSAAIQKALKAHPGKVPALRTNTHSSGRKSTAAEF